MSRERESWWSRMRHKYRLAMLDDVTLREVFHIRMSGLSTFSVLTILFLLIVVLLSVLIVYTPIRNILPGYNASLRQQLIQESARVDSLQSSLSLQRQYLDVIKHLTAGDIQSDSVQSLDSIQIVSGMQLLETHSTVTDEYVAQYEQKERDLLLLFDSQSQRNIQQLYRPSRGVITQHMQPEHRQYGIHIQVAKNENVLSCLRGTIISVEQEWGNTYTLVLQHQQYTSIYRHVGTVLKLTGTQVESGETIGLMTGDDELEFELWKDGKAVNPEEVIAF